jgi:hypothetical protein
MVTVDSMREWRTAQWRSNAAIARIAALDVRTLSSEQVLAITAILDDGNEEPTAAAAAATTAAAAASTSSLLHLPPAPSLSLAVTSASVAAESLLSRLLTPPADCPWSAADFVSSLTASPAIQSLLRMLLTICEQRQPPPLSLHPSREHSLAAGLSSFLSSLESELSCELRACPLPLSPCCDHRLLSPFNVALYVASQVQETISRWCSSEAPPTSRQTAGCGSVFPFSSSSSTAAAAVTIAEGQQETKEPSQQPTAHNSSELWQEGYRAYKLAAATAALPPLFPSRCDWTADSAEESTPPCSLSVSTSSSSDRLVYPSFPLPASAERQQDEKADGSTVWPHELSFASRSARLSAVTSLQKQQQPSPSSPHQVSPQRQSQQSVVSLRSPAAGSAVHWSELEVPIFSSAASTSRWSSSLSSSSDQLHLQLPIELSSQLDSVELGSPSAPPPSPMQPQRKRRRASTELEERERWYCTNSPRCCQFYRKTSSNSIARHQLTCAHQLQQSQHSSTSLSPFSSSLPSSQSSASSRVQEQANPMAVSGRSSTAPW